MFTVASGMKTMALVTGGTIHNSADIQVIDVIVC